MRPDSVPEAFAAFSYVEVCWTATDARRVLPFREYLLLSAEVLEGTVARFLTRAEAIRVVHNLMKRRASA